MTVHKAHVAGAFQQFPPASGNAIMHGAGILDGNAIAVFTAIGMCWSGFFSTHTAMLDSLGYRKMISKAIGAHAIAGLCAGIIAHFLFLLFGA